MKMGRTTRALGCALALIAAAACASAGPGRGGAPEYGSVDQSRARMVSIPETQVMRGEHLAGAKLRFRSDDSAMRPAFRALMDSAAQALTMAPVSVIQKTRVPPSGDKRDYMSLAPYWWPDTTKPNGLPFVRRDGVVNPESRVDHDGWRMHRVVSAAEALALAHYLTDEARYAEKGAALLRVFFLDPATRMNPHLRYGQAVPGVNEGRGIGIIDTRHLWPLLDAVKLLELSEAWTDADRAGMKSWMRGYLDWLLTSEYGLDEQDEENNHGTFYDAQVLALALFVEDSVVARQTLARAKQRLGAQITADGRQPHELERTRPLHYSLFNLDAFTVIAELSRHLGEDLWQYRAPSGASIGAALRFLAPYAGGRTPWPTPEISPAGTDVWVEPMRRGAWALGDTVLAEAVRALPASYTQVHRSRLAFPDVP